MLASSSNVASVRKWVRETRRDAVRRRALCRQLIICSIRSFARSSGSCCCLCPLNTSSPQPSFLFPTLEDISQEEGEEKRMGSSFSSSPSATTADQDKDSESTTADGLIQESDQKSKEFLDQGNRHAYHVLRVSLLSHVMTLSSHSLSLTND